MFPFNSQPGRSQGASFLGSIRNLYGGQKSTEEIEREQERKRQYGLDLAQQIAEKNHQKVQDKRENEGFPVESVQENIRNEESRRQGLNLSHDIPPARGNISETSPIFHQPPSPSSSTYQHTNSPHHLPHQPNITINIDRNNRSGPNGEEPEIIHESSGGGGIFRPGFEDRYNSRRVDEQHRDHRWERGYEDDREGETERRYENKHQPSRRTYGDSFERERHDSYERGLELSKRGRDFQKQDSYDRGRLRDPPDHQRRDSYELDHSGHQRRDSYGNESKHPTPPTTNESGKPFLGALNALYSGQHILNEAQKKKQRQLEYQRDLERQVEERKQRDMLEKQHLLNEEQNQIMRSKLPMGLVSATQPEARQFMQDTSPAISGGGGEPIRRNFPSQSQQQPQTIPFSYVGLGRDSVTPSPASSITPSARGVSGGGGEPIRTISDTSTPIHFVSGGGGEPIRNTPQQNFNKSGGGGEPIRTISDPSTPIHFVSGGGGEPIRNTPPQNFNKNYEDTPIGLRPKSNFNPNFDQAQNERQRAWQNEIKQQIYENEQRKLREAEEKRRSEAEENARLQREIDEIKAQEERERQFERNKAREEEKNRQQLLDKKLEEAARTKKQQALRKEETPNNEDQYYLNVTPRSERRKKNKFTRKTNHSDDDNNNNNNENGFGDKHLVDNDITYKNKSHELELRRIKERQKLHEKELEIEKEMCREKERLRDLEDARRKELQAEKDRIHLLELEKEKIQTNHQIGETKNFAIKQEIEEAKVLLEQLRDLKFSLEREKMNIQQQPTPVQYPSPDNIQPSRRPKAKPKISKHDNMPPEMVMSLRGNSHYVYPDGKIEAGTIRQPPKNITSSMFGRNQRVSSIENIQKKNESRLKKLQALDDANKDEADVLLWNYANQTGTLELPSNNTDSLRGESYYI